MNLLCHDSDRTRKNRPLPLHRKDSERREQCQAASYLRMAKIVKLPE
ncbi:hypothetical protein [Phocaeicola vulgatus]|uniref:Uncharacterized protein n=1 Tax=Phocaeicola vulgatus TaxID=821 RepID=A0AAP3NLP0_PHOVU|nr:hypothetical protein [Phocaeicola vulgatus]MDB0827561.1 hypothetical protein [Phocaeicola vulgatus]MDB0845425.1 hypothetical protein [Phocaeicola vulgatus]MDB0849668.1 hypothetical protein [Phocaeicola vulgatus]MDB0853385.1 hypothetical protein [Phocaeicola vulgatus]MDB0874697.1 hypothetical protein [Phocaeicola vulgatus]